MTGERPSLSVSSARPALVGWLIIALFFGGLGGWAMTAPLNGAVVANGLVKVDGNRKSVQHLDGGLIRELLVREGDTVQAGTVLVVLDDTQARAEFDVLCEQYAALRATEARLMAELVGAGEMIPPTDLAANLAAGRAGSFAQTIWSGQVRQFESRRDAREGQRKVIAEKIHQLQSQIVGAEAQARAYAAQVGSVRAEADSVAPLVDKMLLPRPRLLQLERSAFALEGQVAEATATIAKLRQAIAEHELQIVQIGNDHMAEAAKELRDIQARLAEVVPKRTSAAAVLGRLEIRAPYGGRVVGLNVFSVGGVIQRGEKILDIVPDEETLTVEVQVAVEDVGDVHAGMRADLQLPAFKQRGLPVLKGDVIHVSADRLTDPKTGNPYFVAAIRPDRAQLAGLPEIRLHPGMPATVQIPTEARTAFDYLVGPLTISFSRAFRQK